MVCYWLKTIWQKIVGKSNTHIDEVITPSIKEEYHETYYKGGENRPSSGVAYWRRKSRHQVLVEIFLKGIGHEIPDKPQLPPNPANILLQGRLCAEELWEYFEAAGIRVKLPAKDTASVGPDGKAHMHGDTEIKFSDLRFSFDGGSDLQEMADAWGDIMVIATGGLSMCGISDYALLEEIDNNNLLKLKNGHPDSDSGKLIKPKNHPRPNIERVLKAQGMV
jgi:predicted HAD superfamily Cof-like phosphohydrolase